MIDLTTLEGADTPGKVRSLCAKAPVPTRRRDRPPVAAVCVYPDLVETAGDALRGSGVKIASVATAFPSGRAALSTKLRTCVTRSRPVRRDRHGDRPRRVPPGRYLQVFDEIVAIKAGVR